MTFITTFLTAMLAVIAPALAQTSGSSGGAGGPSLIEQVIPFLAFFAIFYFFIIRPQSRRHKEHANFVAQMKRGDNVITTGGIFGRVEGITDQFVTLEVSDGVQIRVLKSQIASSLKEGSANA